MLDLLKLTAVWLMVLPALLVELLMRRAESRRRLNRLIAPLENVTSVLVWLRPGVDKWLVPAEVLLTLELLKWLS